MNQAVNNLQGIGVFTPVPHAAQIKGLWTISACAEGGFVVLGGCTVQERAPHLFAGDEEACIGFVREKMKQYSRE